MHRLAPLFDFQSMALVGASDTNNTGLSPYLALQTLGFNGRYYPINPRRDEVHGRPAFASIASLPEPPDMVVIAIPRDGVPAVVEDCAARGVKAAVVCSAGFVEQDLAGAELQAQMAAAARRSGLLLIGPNCFGVASIANRCAGISAGLQGILPGNVGVISNSGGLLNEIMSYGSGRGIGFSHLVSSGNEAGVTAAEILDYFVDDPKTDVVLAVLESVRNPALFVQASSRALAAGKPIVVVKMGSSEKGAASTVTHTGALAGSDAVYSALFRQKGVTRVNDIDELIDMGALYSTSVGVLRGHRLERAAIIEISGGGKGLVSDTAAAAGVELPDLSETAAEELAQTLPDKIYPTNPIDTEGSWNDANKSEVYPLVLDAFARQPNVDMVISRYSLPRSGGLGPLEVRLRELEAVRAAYPDRLFAVLSRTSDQFSEEWLAVIRDKNLPFAQGYGRGLRAFGRLAEYSRAYHGGPAPSAAGQGGAEGAKGQPQQSASPTIVLSEIDSKRLLAKAGIPVVETVAAGTMDDAVREAARLGYPVAVKVIAPDITHKSDAGGVYLNLRDADAVRQAFQRLQALSAAFQGVALQPMAQPGVEVVLGANRDAQFGPVILFGLGGVFVEVLGDVALRVAPLTIRDAQAMLDDIRGRRLLDGVRGQPPLDRAALADALCKLSAFMLDSPDVASVDVNPVFVYPRGLLAVDARIVRSS